MFGIISSRPCDAVKVVVRAPACSAPCTAPAAPPSLCISITSGTVPKMLRPPLGRPGVRQLAHRRGGRDRIDRDHFVGLMRDIGGGFVSINRDKHLLTHRWTPTSLKMRSLKNGLRHRQNSARFLSLFVRSGTLIINPLTRPLDATRPKIQRGSGDRSTCNVHATVAASSSSREPIQLNCSEMWTSTRVNTGPTRGSARPLHKCNRRARADPAGPLATVLLTLIPPPTPAGGEPTAGTSTKTPQTLRLLEVDIIGPLQPRCLRFPSRSSIASPMAKPR